MNGGRYNPAAVTGHAVQKHGDSIISSLPSSAAAAGAQFIVRALGLWIVIIRLLNYARCSPVIALMS